MVSQGEKRKYNPPVIVQEEVELLERVSDVQSDS